MTKLDLLIALTDVHDNCEIRIVTERDGAFLLQIPEEAEKFETPLGDVYFGIFLPVDSDSLN